MWRFPTRSERFEPHIGLLSPGSPISGLENQQGLMSGRASGLQETETPFLKIHTKCHVLQAPVQRKQFERTWGRIHLLILECLLER